MLKGLGVTLSMLQPSTWNFQLSEGHSQRRCGISNAELSTWNYPVGIISMEFSKWNFQHGIFHMVFSTWNFNIA
jgi:hypothetical protein